MFCLCFICATCCAVERSYLQLDAYLPMTMGSCKHTNYSELMLSHDCGLRPTTLVLVPVALGPPVVPTATVAVFVSAAIPSFICIVVGPALCIMCPLLLSPCGIRWRMPMTIVGQCSVIHDSGFLFLVVLSPFIVSFTLGRGAGAPTGDSAFRLRV